MVLLLQNQLGLAELESILLQWEELKQFLLAQQLFLALLFLFPPLALLFLSRLPLEKPVQVMLFQSLLLAQKLLLVLE
jgi:hypothetical protein